jgi:hypothetical protein
MTAKRLPLPHRFQAAMTEAAYERLRLLNTRYGLSNNYLLSVLLEHLDAYANEADLDRVFDAFVSEYGAPAPGTMTPRKKGKSNG